MTEYKLKVNAIYAKHNKVHFNTNEINIITCSNFPSYIKMGKPIVLKRFS